MRYASMLPITVGLVAAVGTMCAGSVQQPAAVNPDGGLTNDGGAHLIGVAGGSVPTKLTTDGSALYWIDHTGVRRMSTSGGAQDLLYASTAVLSTFLTLDDGNIYVMERGALLRIPKSGGSVFATVDGGIQPTALTATVFRGTVYWVVQTASGPGETFTVQSADLKGGPITSVGQLQALGPPPSGIGVAGSAVLLSGQAGLGLLTVADGGPTKAHPVPGFAGDCAPLLSDTNAVYCITKGYAASLVRIDGNGSVETLAPNAESSLDIASDVAEVYWVSNEDILRAPKTTGQVTVVGQRAHAVVLALSDTNLYWSDAKGNFFSQSK